MEIRCSKAQWSNSVEFLLVSKSDRGVFAARTVELREVEEGSYLPPTGNLDGTAAQLLMDDLWRCGFRPSEGSGNAGSLAATERHLKDMQMIAKGLLKKDGVEV